MRACGQKLVKFCTLTHAAKLVVEISWHNFFFSGELRTICIWPQRNNAMGVFITHFHNTNWSDVSHQYHREVYSGPYSSSCSSMTCPHECSGVVWSCLQITQRSTKRSRQERAVKLYTGRLTSCETGLTNDHFASIKIYFGDWSDIGCYCASGRPRTGNPWKL